MKANLSFLAWLVLTTRAFAAEWEPVTTELLKTEKPGFGGVSGVVVDRSAGDVYIWLSDRGLYRSVDQGATWKPFGPRIKGRTEWPGCMLTNPAGALKSWVIAAVYGGPIRSSDDAGETWKAMDAKSGHVDWVAVDWSDPARRFVLTLKHESGDLLLASQDGGQTFREVGKGFGPACIFDHQTAVIVQIIPGEGPKKASKRILARTTDGAKTFQPVAEYSIKAVPSWFGDSVYWLTDRSVITTSDQGRTWKELGALRGGVSGPAFGKDAKQQFVLTNAGVVESGDGGATWSAPLTLPKEMKGTSPLSWVAYDPKGDVLYVMKMGSELYRLKRGK
jgi:hypothetical protein